MRPALPLLLFVVIAAQAGLRVAVDQPAPGRAYEISRPFVGGAAGATLDVADATLRGAFEAAAPTSSLQRRGTFPSGHAARTLFLALLATSHIRAARGWPAPLRRMAIAGLAVLCLLVGYSTLYFGYHWPTDIVGGYLIGLAGYQLATWLDGLARARQAVGSPAYG